MRWFIAAALSSAWSSVAAEDLRPGRYQVAVEITLPNIDTSDYDFQTEICWRGTSAPGMPLGPMGPGPLRDCPSVVSDTTDGLLVETICEGPNAGWAVSIYHPTPTGFKGRIDMNMGGKNMRVGEIQRARWLGPCG